MITIRDLYKAHSARVVIDHLNADVKAGETIAITGPSGVGKTTLLRCLNYLESFDGGTIEIAGVQLKPGLDHGHKKELRELRSVVGMVFQQFNLFPHLTALQNITLAPRIVSNTPPDVARKEAVELLARVGLADRAESYPHQLSGGQQQRVAIARALAQKPKVLLFDEPTSALDPAMREEVIDVIQELSRAGLTMLIVTHEIEFARRLAHRVWEMQAGKIISIQKHIAN